MADALTLTAHIVSAHVRKNGVQADQLADLIRSVYDALTATSAPEPRTREPAVPIRKSVFHDRILCLECGKGFRTLKRHLEREHGISTGDYRARFALPRDYPLTAPEHAEVRSEIARQIGLGRRLDRKGRRK